MSYGLESSLLDAQQARMPTSTDYITYVLMRDQYDQLRDMLRGTFEEVSPESLNRSAVLKMERATDGDVVRTVDDTLNQSSPGDVVQGQFEIVMERLTAAQASGDSVFVAQYQQSPNFSGFRGKVADGSDSAECEAHKKRKDDLNADFEISASEGVDMMCLEIEQSVSPSGERLPPQRFFGEDYDCVIELP